MFMLQHNAGPEKPEKPAIDMYTASTYAFYMLMKRHYFDITTLYVDKTR